MSGQGSRAVTTVAVGLLLAGCGVVPGMDTGAVERFVLESQSSTYADLEVGPATCSGDGELREGMTVRCTLTVADADVPYLVRLRDVREEKVRADVSLDGVVLLTTRIQDYVRSVLPERFASAEVTCGHEVIVTEVGADLECLLASGAQTEPLTVTVEDAEGHVSIS